jgi:DUF4097 and DUF4098 domain-containing protein YvlB
VELYVPASSANKLNVVVRSGAAAVKGFSGELDMRVQSGAAAVEGFSGKVDIYVNSGAVTVKDFSGAGAFTINSGAISLGVADMKGDISVSMSSSVLDLEINKNVSCTLDMEMSSGLFNGTRVSARRPVNVTETIGTAPEYTLTLDSSSGVVNVIRP